MKKDLLLLTLLWTASVVAAAEATTIYVSPNGADDAVGTQQSPLRTLMGARDAVRKIRNEPQSITVVFAAGTYSFDKAVVFEKQDSGTADAPITFRAEERAKVRFTGGRSVSTWGPVTDKTILERLMPEARNRVLVADLRAQGITDFGRLPIQGFARGIGQTEAEVFFNDRPMMLARWPNEGFQGIKGTDGILKVKVGTDRIARWKDETDPWVFAYWHHDWAEIIEPLAGVDAENGLLIRTEKVKPNYGITPGRARWYARNLLSELDRAGEYYIDRTNGKLYLWPPEKDGRVTISISAGLIQGENLSHVTFEGFTLEASRASAITLKGGTECHVVGCTVRNIGLRGISVSGGTKHEVYGCDIYHCGEGGISMWGGDRRTLTPAEHNAENNHVYHYSRRTRTYRSAISVSGVGNRIAHNLIHDGPHMALSASGNDHLVEFNEIHNVVEESGDAGAYYVGRDWTQRGNVLRYNYWHQIVGATGHGGMTIYLDDQHSGHTIHGNLFERCSRAVFVGGGDDNIVTNNVFLDCWKAAHIDNRGMGWQKKATDDPKGSLRTRLADMPIHSDLWKQRYPNLPNTLEDEPNIPKRNLIERNISAGGSWNDVHKGTLKYQTVRNNLVRDDDPDFIRLEKDAHGRPKSLIFKDAAAIQALKFEPIPLQKMGVYQDPRRASWPVIHEVRRIKLHASPKPQPATVQAGLSPNPTFTVSKSDAVIKIDGILSPDEWLGMSTDKALKLSVNYDGGLVSSPANAWLSHDGKSIRIAMTTPLPKKRALGTTWGGNEAVELAFRAADGPNADTLVLRGFTNGKWLASPDAGAGEAAIERLKKGVEYAAKVSADSWSAEWSVPLASLGVVAGDRIRFNLTVRRTAGNLWIMWRPTRGNSFLVERVGTLELR